MESSNAAGTEQKLKDVGIEAYIRQLEAHNQFMQCELRALNHQFGRLLYGLTDIIEVELEERDSRIAKLKAQVGADIYTYTSSPADRRAHIALGAVQRQQTSLMASVRDRLPSLQQQSTAAEPEMQEEAWWVEKATSDEEVTALWEAKREKKTRWSDQSEEDDGQKESSDQEANQEESSDQEANQEEDPPPPPPQTSKKKDDHSLHIPGHILDLHDSVLNTNEKREPE